MILLYVLVLHLLCEISSSSASECPVGCTCTERLVRCMRLQLTAIPEIPSDTNILDLRYNFIREIPANTFQGLSHLHTIFLNENQLRNVNSGAFHGLPSLKYLYLDKNRISNVSADAFQGLNHLDSLYLQYNSISEISPETFSNLPHLRKLYLHNNKITQLKNGLFENMVSLKRLRLDNNDFVCNCNVLWLLKFLGKSRHIEADIVCKHPANLMGKNLIDLNETDLDCESPTIIEEPSNITAGIGDTVSLKCRASGHPTPDIVWMQNSIKVPLDSPRYHLMNDGTLKIKDVNADLAGMYECMAQNVLGETKSRQVRMAIGYQSNQSSRNNNINRPGKPRLTLKPADSTVSPPANIVLHCVAKGDPTPTISWYLEDNLLQWTNGIRVHPNGTLTIENPTVDDSGTYKCEATNYLGKETATAEVHVNEMPYITLAPEDQILKIGSYVVMECEATGQPTPTIMWKVNGQPVDSSSRMFFGNQNTELHIEQIKESDEGTYVCVAENSIGSTEAEATITVQKDVGPPTLIFEPYDIEAIPGTTIEMPCQGEGSPKPEVKWKKDGKTIIASAKHRIAPGGSLYIKKINEQDAGRYECSVVNANGRATASGVVTISRTNEVTAPGDRYVRIAYTEASQEIDKAINQTVASLFSKDSNKTFHHSDYFKIFRYPNAPTRELARAAEVYERTLLNIRKHIDKGASVSVNMSEFNYKDILSPDHLDLVAQLSGCQAHRIIPNCTNMCFHLKYRSVDGTCNNLQHSSWGASLTGFRRILQPIYENGFSSPIGWTKGKLYFGFPKPSARLVSTSVIATKVITQDETITHMVMQWGQFLDHDLDHAIPSVSSESWDGIDCKKSCEYAAPCYPIEVPENDPRIKNRRCIDLVRSSAICGSGMTSVFFDDFQPREQINQLTSYIDASQVYGYSVAFAQDLRNLTTNDGLLRVGVNFPNQKSMLPFASPTDGIDCRRNIEESNVNCFTAGDIRVNEQIGLTAMHTIWLREHNRIAIELKELNRHWDGETLYQEARKIVGAQMQHITYSHWLPNIIGAKGMEMLGEYKGYDPTVNPSVSNEFATAALRFGHTLINPILHRLNETFEPIAQGHLPLHKAFFAPWRMVYEGGVDPLLRGMFSVPAKLKMPTENLNTELTEKLFLTAHAVALDLAAINIQRSRDHGIPGYNEYRKVCNLPVAETFDDLKNEISSDVVRNKLKELYGHPGNIDIFVGGILEDQIDGARIGPLFRCILIEQFSRLRSGDRHWYENPSAFTPEQLSQIKVSSLGRVLCDNGDNIAKIPENVFHLASTQGGYKDCIEIPKMNLSPWLNCNKCSGHADLDLPTGDPNLRRQRRSIKMISNDTQDQNALNEFNFDFNEMSDERIEGLEILIENFQKTLSRMKRKIKKLEHSCSNDKTKMHGHCVDDEGIKRLNYEIWSKDECTQCQCKHRQVNCMSEKCSQLYCGPNVEVVKRHGECCPHCDVNSVN